MIDRLVLTRRVEEIGRHLEKIEPYSKQSLEDFLENPTAQDIVEYNLYQIVNHLMDIVQHIAVDEDYGYPLTAYEAGQMLLEHGVFAGDDLEVFRKMVGFRNVIAHDYIHINKKIVHSILTAGQKDIKILVSKIVKKFL
jgi:uncharacterized protein YutE (UPF0331/DUF86 family)